MNIINVSDIDIPELSLFQERRELRLIHMFEPEPGLFIAESPLVAGRALAAGYEPVSVLSEEGADIGSLIPLTDRYPEVPVYMAPEESLLKITGYRLTRGMLCLMKRKPLPGAAEICAGASRIAVLENVVNPANVGSVFRSAAALGIDAVLLTKGSSDPLYRRAARVSMGNVFNIPWTYIDSCSVLDALGFKTAALCLSPDSVPIDSPVLKAEKKLALVLGTEGEGLLPETMASCDHKVIIPMSNDVDSLNVAAAAAIAFWELCR